MKIHPVIMPARTAPDAISGAEPCRRGYALGSKATPEGRAFDRWPAKLSSRRPKWALPKS
ncbi:hypothetical protein QF032_000589 [Streptomyces achromogenes]|nr:hypothetical protein [Streptomyces achromogenes]